MLKLASWNVNSLNVRLAQVLEWMNESNVDVLALQETKVTDDAFPIEAFQDLGFHVSFSGQKTYNGVAIISKTPLEGILTSFPNLDDPQRRVLAATVAGIRLINLYVPNGQAPDSDKYTYKLTWLNHAKQFIKQELSQHPYLAVVGDFNIAPDDRDVHEPNAWKGSVLVSPAERQAFSELLALGLHDSFRSFPQPENSYSWWDYRTAAFRQNKGLRIDHILLSTALNTQCTMSQIDKAPREADRPSDHAPVWVMV
jgi:exodeoxyribonuclease-3